MSKKRVRSSNESNKLRAALLAAPVFLLLAGCRNSTPPRGGMPPPQVSVVTATPAAVPESFAFPAEVQPYRRVEVRARVDGIIVARPFTEGSMVKQGEILYRLDQVRYKAAFESAQARFENASRTYDRLQPLLAQHAVAQQDVDNAHYEFQSAQAALDEAKKDLDDTVIRAEVDGRVGRTQLEVGARVTGPADLLTTIDRLDPIYVTFEPSSEQLLTWRADPATRALIEPGSPLVVQVVLPDGSVLPRTGRLDFVAPSLDAATGTQEFRAVFDNPEHILVPGQAVRARLVGIARKDAIAVPERAVQTALGRQFVYVVSPGDTVQARDVRTGSWSGHEWIIEQGLHPGDRVVVDGVQKVMPGRPVHPVALADSSKAQEGSDAGSAPGHAALQPGASR